jgi:hypothetical protein
LKLGFPPLSSERWMEEIDKDPYYHLLGQYW